MTENCCFRVEGRQDKGKKPQDDNDYYGRESPVIRTAAKGIIVSKTMAIKLVALGTQNSLTGTVLKNVNKT